MITFKFEGTSHGEGYRGVIKGLPAGFTFEVEQINKILADRKGGYGRSSRQTYQDKVVFDGFGDVVTTSGDLSFFVANAKMEQREEITALRSGHSDLVGQSRFPNMTARQLAEISSARNSVCYVVLGAICKLYLQQKGIFTYHYVKNIGGIASRNRYEFGKSEKLEHFPIVHCPCRYATKLICEKIDSARAVGDSLGGIVVVGVTGLPMGVGEILPYDMRLDAQISANLMGIPSVKGIAFGMGEKYASQTGTECVDSLQAIDGTIQYQTNNCGGIVSGISTGKDIVCQLVVKPVPTVKNVQTVDSKTLQTVPQHYERADTCVVPNVGVIAENIIAYVVLNQMDKQGLL